jgi:hypothetical protein
MDSAWPYLTTPAHRRLLPIWRSGTWTRSTLDVRPKSPLELAEFQALARSQLSGMGRHMSLDQLLDSCQLPLPPIEPGRGAENGEIRFTLPGGADRGSVPAGGGVIRVGCGPS